MGSSVTAGLGAHHIDLHFIFARLASERHLEAVPNHIDLHFIFARLGSDTVKFIALCRTVKYGFIVFGCPYVEIGVRAAGFTDAQAVALAYGEQMLGGLIAGDFAGKTLLGLFVCRSWF